MVFGQLWLLISMSLLSILLVVLSSACSKLYTVHSSCGTIETDKFDCVAVNTYWYWNMFPSMVSEWRFLTMVHTV